MPVSLTTSLYEFISGDETLPESTADILAVLLGGQVNRFHNFDTIKPTTVAHHSWGVAMFCWLLTDGKCSPRLMLAALVHDMPECVTGDVPAPMKWLYPQVGESCDRAEAHFFDCLQWVTTVSEDERRILKIADVLEGLLSCVRERRLGNQNIEVVYKRWLKHLSTLLSGLAGHTMSRLNEYGKTINELWEDSIE